MRRSEKNESGNRYLITISEFARINVPDAWHGRNPVHYTSLDELGISLDGIEFQPLPEASRISSPQKKEEASVPMLTISEAKKALAATYGIEPEAIEITIHG